MKPNVENRQQSDMPDAPGLIVFEGSEEMCEDDEENAYLDICKQIDGQYGWEDTEAKIDKVYKKLKMQNNRLQDIKQRKASKYD